MARSGTLIVTHMLAMRNPCSTGKVTWLHLKDRIRVLIEDLPDADDEMIVSSLITVEESDQVDIAVSDVEPIGKTEDYSGCIGAVREVDTVHTVLGGVTKTLDPVLFAESLSERRDVGAFASSIGATSISDYPYLVPDEDTTVTEPMTDDEDDFDLGDPMSFEEEDLYEFFQASGTTASQTSGVSPEFLSKIWRIDVKDAKRTLEMMTQLLKHSEDPTLQRNYSTNDRMLCYKRIHQHFFMDTFYATKKAGKSSRGYTCMQLFVTDKGFVYVVPMKSKGQVSQAMKMFAKEIGAPDAFVCDDSGEQTSKEVRSFCHKIGTSLRILGRGNSLGKSCRVVHRPTQGGSS